jgi:predicted dehydrogenase
MPSPANSDGPAPDFTMQHGPHRPPLCRRLRLGFVGGGRGGQVGAWHAAGARLSGRWDIVAGALSTDPGTAALSARDWGLDQARSYADHRAMAAAEAAHGDGIEAVSICTPNWTHAPIASEFLRKGIDVILDKPMAMSTAEVEQLITLQKETGLTLALTYSFAHHAMVRQATLMVDQGAIGRVRQAHVEFVQDWGTAADAPDNRAAAWRRDPAKVGRASTVGDIGTHAYHLLKTVSGLEIEELRAEFHVCGAPKQLEDTAFVSLRLTSGVPGLRKRHQGITRDCDCGCSARRGGWSGIRSSRSSSATPRSVSRSESSSAEQGVVYCQRPNGSFTCLAAMERRSPTRGPIFTPSWGS